jgi:cell division protein FtsL
MNNDNKPKKAAKIKPSRLGKTSRVVIIVVVFLMVFAAIFYVYQQQTAKQFELGQELSSLHNKVSAQSNTGSDLEVQTSRAEQYLADVKSSFSSPDEAPEILDELISLAKANDMEITSTRITRTKGTFNIEKQKVEFPVLKLQMGFRGQVPKFQNFMLSLESVLPASQIKELGMQVTQEEGEQDIGSLSIEIYCLKEG